MFMLLNPRVQAVTITDLFNRSNSSSLGSDWTETILSGSGLGINSNALTWQGSTDGTAYALHNTPLATDEFDISITASSSSATADSRIIGGCNAGASVFAGLNWYNNKIFLVKSTGSYTSTSDLDDEQSGVSISAGTVIRFRRFFTEGHFTYLADVGGSNKITFPDTSDQIATGPSNRFAGCGLERIPFSTNSGGFNDFTAVG